MSFGAVYKIVVPGNFTVISANLLFKNCTQPNFFEIDGVLPYFATERWGIMGSNYSKNISYEDCRLSRLDAHCGVYNASLKNCEVVYISVVGGGTLTVEDTVVYNDNVVQLRGDYGSSWKGDVILKNVKLMNQAEPTVFSAAWTNHDYGYQTYLPENVYIDGLEIYRGSSISIYPVSFVEKGDIGAETYGAEKNENPMIPTKQVIVKNNTDGIEYVLEKNNFFKDMVIKVE